MCGITGFVYSDPERPAETRRLWAMCEAIHHRGPDERGAYTHNNTALGMQRLSIIDLAGGSQPLFTMDRQAWVVFNGEIYNFPDLRAELIERGYQFRSHTDTEVIVHAYDCWGENFLSRLSGMFAIALWDDREKKLILARDRVGKKPLYYWIDGEKIVFGSELKALLAGFDLPRSLNRRALHNYLSLNYIPAPATILEGFSQLLPGHLLEWKGGGSAVRCYWDLVYRSEADRSEASFVDELRHHIKESVRRRLISDVPLGAFLSGGVDSAAVVGAMARLLNTPVKTFTIGFGEKSYDETDGARFTSALFGCDHTEFRIEPHLEKFLPEFVWHCDNLMCDPAAFPLYLLAEEAKKHVTVVLTGDGGDEVFVGYETFLANEYARRYRTLPTPLRRFLIEPIVRALPVSTKKMSFEFKAKRFVDAAHLDYYSGHVSWRRIFSEAEKSALYAEGTAVRAEDYAPTLESFAPVFAAARDLERVNGAQYIDIKTFLPDDILMKVDSMTMAHALEARCPFLDHELIEFMATVPPAVKFRRNHLKYLFKKAIAEWVPKEILTGKKAGFNIPMSDWFKGELKDWTHDALSPQTIRRQGILDPAAVKRILEDHTTGRRDAGYPIWNLLCLTLWVDRFLGRDRPQAP